MASIQISYPVNMLNPNTWYGNISSYDTNHITISNGDKQGTYTGSFTYDSSGNVYGTLTGYTLTISGQVALSASGLNVDAHYAERLIQTDQIQAFLQTALSGNDQFTLAPGPHAIDGYGGYNTVTEPMPYSSYSMSNNNGVLSITDHFIFMTNDTYYNIQGVYFSDGFYDSISGTFSPNTSTAGFSAVDVSTGHPVAGSPQSYTGPVQGLQKQYVSVTSDNLNISVSSDNWFIHTGSGTDAIAVHGGTNVLDGGVGSNFLTGGNGFDTFFVDDRGPAADIWSTVVGFHAGDAATVWGVTPQDFTLNWADGQGAAGFTGLTLHATSAGRPTASLTLAGYTQADMAAGRLSVSFGTDPASGSAYMYVHGNS